MCARSQADILGGATAPASTVAQVTRATCLTPAVSIASSTCLLNATTLAIRRESGVARETTSTVTAVTVSTTLGTTSTVVVKARSASVGVAARGGTGVTVGGTGDAVEAVGVRSHGAVGAGGSVAIVAVGATLRAAACDSTIAVSADCTAVRGRARCAVSIVASDWGNALSTDQLIGVAGAYQASTRRVRMAPCATALGASRREEDKVGTTSNGERGLGTGNLVCGEEGLAAVICVVHVILDHVSSFAATCDGAASVGSIRSGGIPAKVIRSTSTITPDVTKIDPMANLM